MRLFSTLAVLLIVPVATATTSDLEYGVFIAHYPSTMQYSTTPPLRDGVKST